MDLSAPVFKYLLLFVLVIGWIYYRMVRSLRRQQKRHGRHLWRDRLRERREQRMCGAETWEERRERLAALNPERRIANRFLRGTKTGTSDGEPSTPEKESPE